MNGINFAEIFRGVTNLGKYPPWGKFILFVSSYSPLFAILGLRAHSAEYTILGHYFPAIRAYGLQFSLLSIISFIISFLSIVFLYVVVIWTKRSRQGNQITIVDSQNRTDMFTEYLLVYIFPFIGLEFGNVYDVSAFFLLFLTVGAIVIRSNRLYVNPILNIFFRYRVYEIDTKEASHLLLTKKLLSGERNTINVARIRGGVYISTQE